MTLTPRELDVMVALAINGDDYVVVSRVLGIKVQTVKNHANNARRAYGVRTNAAWFREAGWLTVPDAVRHYRARRRANQ